MIRLLLIAYEHAESLDSHSGEAVIQLFRQLVEEEQRTVVIVSHD